MVEVKVWCLIVPVAPLRGPHYWSCFLSGVIFLTDTCRTVTNYYGQCKWLYWDWQASVNDFPYMAKSPFVLWIIFEICHVQDILTSLSLHPSPISVHVLKFIRFSPQAIFHRITMFLVGDVCFWDFHMTCFCILHFRLLCVLSKNSAKACKHARICHACTCYDVLCLHMAHLRARIKGQANLINMYPFLFTLKCGLYTCMYIHVHETFHVRSKPIIGYLYSFLCLVTFKSL